MWTLSTLAGGITSSESNEDDSGSDDEYYMTRPEDDEDYEDDEEEVRDGQSGWHRARSRRRVLQCAIHHRVSLLHGIACSSRGDDTRDTKISPPPSPPDTDLKVAAHSRCHSSLVSQH